MNLKWRHTWFQVTCGLISVATVASAFVALPGQALEFPPSSDRGAPSRTAGGGVRGAACIAADKTNLTALMPKNNVGTTVSTSPTLFFYVPKLGKATAEFVMTDDQGKDVYQTLVQLPKTEGVITLKLPEVTRTEVPLLKANKTYSWTFSVICDEEDPSRDLTVEGMVQRLPLNSYLQTALKSHEEDLLQQAEIYAKAGIWQETLVIAAKLHKTTPDVWEGLLKSVELPEIAKAKLIGCY